LPFLPLTQNLNAQNTPQVGFHRDLDQERHIWKEKNLKAKLHCAQEFLDKMLPHQELVFQGMEISAFLERLSDGVLLLDVVESATKEVCAQANFNSDRRSIISRVVRGTPLGKFCQAMENIHSFQQVCRDLGMVEDEILSLSDLMEKRSHAVINCLLSLQAALYNKYGALAGLLCHPHFEDTDEPTELADPPTLSTQAESWSDTWATDDQTVDRQTMGLKSASKRSMNNASQNRLSDEMQRFLTIENEEDEGGQVMTTRSSSKNMSFQKLLSPKGSFASSTRSSQRNQTKESFLNLLSPAALASDTNSTHLHNLANFEKIHSLIKKESHNIYELSSVHRNFRSTVHQQLAAFDRELQHHSGALLNLIKVQINKQADVEQRLKDECALRRRIFNELQEIRGNIRVFCRIRPSKKDVNRCSVGPIKNGQSADACSDGGDEPAVWPKSDCELLARPTARAINSSHRQLMPKPFQFDMVFGPESSQVQVFKEVSPLILSVLDGYHACILAYGQTGSGKTYTMEGNEDDPGINVRALQELFRLKREFEKERIKELEVEVSMLEIYNETVRDLLVSSYTMPNLLVAETHNVLEIRQGSDGVYVEGIRKVVVEDAKGLRQVMRRGAAHRSVSATRCNEQSSRSHSLVTIDVKVSDLATSEVIRGRLVLVDLAGSERISRSGAEGQTLKEANAINKSLSALGDVIAGLRLKQGKKDGTGHIPYRNSKLTFLLQDSLGAENKALMIVQVSPEFEDLEETICSLNFGARVRCVELGQAKTHTDSSEQISRAKETIKRSMQDEMTQKISSMEHQKDQAVQVLQQQVIGLNDTLRKKELEIKKSADEKDNATRRLQMIQEKNSKLVAENNTLQQKLNKLMAASQSNSSNVAMSRASVGRNTPSRRHNTPSRRHTIVGPSPASLQTVTPEESADDSVGVPIASSYERVVTRKSSQSTIKIPVASHQESATLSGGRNQHSNSKAMVQINPSKKVELTVSPMTSPKRNAQGHASQNTPEDKKSPSNALSSRIRSANSNIPSKIPSPRIADSTNSTAHGNRRIVPGRSFTNSLNKASGDKRFSNNTETESVQSTDRDSESSFPTKRLPQGIASDPKQVKFKLSKSHDSKYLSPSEEDYEANDEASQNPRSNSALPPRQKTSSLVDRRAISAGRPLGMPSRVVEPLPTTTRKPATRVPQKRTSLTSIGESSQRR